MDRMLDSLVSKVTEKIGKPNVVAVDVGYKTQYIFVEKCKNPTFS
ncbi:hypothetical protein [Bacillus safensis]